MTQEMNVPGKCSWNGNEIVDAIGKVVAGIVPEAPEAWGYMFAAAPELYEELSRISIGVCIDTAHFNRIQRLLDKARGE